MKRALPPTFRPASRASRRGFTLAEVLMVLALMSLLAVTASPTFVRLMRDRRVNRAAMHLVDTYRTGRTRAMGHGQPMLVRWDPASGITSTDPGSQGLVQLLEPNVTTAGSASTCAQTAWANARQVTRIDFKSGAYTYTQAQFFDDVAPGALKTYAEICFAPSGRTYIRFSGSGTFREMTGVAYFNVTNSFTGLVRKVFIPPSGVARMQL